MKHKIEAGQVYKSGTHYYIIVEAKTKTKLKWDCAMVKWLDDLLLEEISHSLIQNDRLL
jgi:hypothetical protein